MKSPSFFEYNLAHWSSENPIEILAGQYFDQETDLHYNYHRYYDPKTGRYLTPDPIGLVGGINLYAYTSNNPINAIDQFGLYESSPWLMWVPGQHSWDRSLTAIENGQYGWGAVYFGAMVGEQVLFALTLGESGLIKSGGQCAYSTSVSQGAPKLLNAPINVTQKGLKHVLDRHTINNIAKFANKSKFKAGEDLVGLIRSGTQQRAVQQANGNFARTIDVGRKIGVDRSTGGHTSVMTIITRPNGDLVTAFPGLP